MISPDGQRIAYFGRNPENNNIALYVREIDGLERVSCPNGARERGKRLRRQP
jgi:hypothetical protein